jgi:hypothetical protein
LREKYVQTALIKCHLFNMWYYQNILMLKNDLNYII